MLGEVSAIVLAGGRSRRMGTDKGSLVLGDRTLLELAVDRVTPLASEVIVAVNEPPAIHLRSARIVADLEPDVGPLMGLYSALRTCRASHAVVVAPDMPFLTPALLEAMVRICRPYDIVAARWNGRVEPLGAVYSKGILPTIERCLRRGNRSLRSLYEQPSLAVSYLDDAAVLRYGDPRVLFFNLNTADHVEEARRLALRARTSTAPGPGCRADRVALETVPPPAIGKETHDPPRSIRARDRLPAHLAHRSM